MIYISNTMGKGEISFELKDFDRMWYSLQIIRVFWFSVVPVSRAVGRKCSLGKKYQLNLHCLCRGITTFLPQNYYFSPTFSEKTTIFLPLFYYIFPTFSEKTTIFLPLL